MPAITLQQFSELVRAHETFEMAPDSVVKNLSVGSRLFGKLKWLKPGQKRYSFDLSMEKAVEYSGVANPFLPDLLKSKRILHYDNGQSLLPEEDPIFVALTDYGMVVVDGHHHVMASLATGATTAPLLVTHDLRNRNSKNLREELWRLGLTYPIDLDGSVRQPQHFYTLVDDTNRYLISLLTIRVDAKKDGEVVKIGKKGGNYPVIIKIRRKSLPFQELRLADVLRRAGFIYDAKKFGNDPPKEVREACRAIFAEAVANGEPEMRAILMVSSRTHVDEIPFEYLVRQWLSIPHALNQRSLWPQDPSTQHCPVILQGEN